MSPNSMHAPVIHEILFQMNITTQHRLRQWNCMLQSTYNRDKMRIMHVNGDEYEDSEFQSNSPMLYL
jgi:hypothetical protein